MAAAICGAKTGLDAFPAERIAELERINSLDFRGLAEEIIDGRSRFHY